MKIYTKTGDSGMTSIRGGQRLPKTNIRIIAYGTIDEANAALGIATSLNVQSDISNILTRIQNELFVVGSDLSNPDSRNNLDRVSQLMIENLEKDIDQLDKMLPTLSNFILPGGSQLAAHLHHARTIVRRAEIQTLYLKESEQINPFCTIYLNRLSDLLFILGRLANKKDGIGDVIWKS